MVINLPLMWAGAWEKHAAYVRDRISDFFLNEYMELHRPLTEGQQRAVSFLIQYHVAIANPRKSDFTRIAKKYDRRFPQGSLIRKDARAIFEKIFDYQTFRDRRTGWCAYALCGLARWTLCPYCHIVGTETDGEGEPGSHRGQLDHFLGHADYPFLALSLGNLVPSCGKCNTGLKLFKNFAHNPHLHPLIDKENVRFEVLPASATDYDNVEVMAFLAPSNRYILQVSERTPCAKTSASIATFKLNILYKPYLGLAHTIARQAVKARAMYSTKSRQQMVRQATTLDIDDLICGFDHKERFAYKSAPTGRMQLDILEGAFNT
jgi:hypothetical protein